MAEFPTIEWLNTLMEKLNTDERYAQVARNWEGDMTCVIEADDSLDEEVVFYLDLWHGKCRDAYVPEKGSEKEAFLILRGPYKNYKSLLKGELEVIQALLTRKVSVHSNFAVLMRNVPTVLDFVRCCREVTDGFV